MFIDRLRASPPLPRDPVLGVTEAFLEDPRPSKVNLGVGIYTDERGRPPELAALARARALLAQNGPFLSYLPIDGLKDLGAEAIQLAFGSAAAAVPAQNRLSIQAPGGTGALYLVAALAAELDPAATIHIPDPTWDNHRAVFEAAGCAVRAYPYWSVGEGLRIEAMLDYLRDLSPGAIVLFQASCHNPTGVDPNADQWRAIAEVVAARGIVPILDCAYAGLGDGLDEDTRSIRILAQAAPCCFVTWSFSKSMSLYGERVGALLGLFPEAASRERALGLLKRIARTRYSNPPSYGARLAEIVLRDPDLARSWREDLQAMRERLASLRTRLAGAFRDKGRARAAAMLEGQRGLFAYGWLADGAAEALREQRGLYMLSSGRICVPAINESNFERVAAALAEYARE